MQPQMNNNMATSAKTQNKKKKKSIISLSDRKKLVIAHYQMYRAFLLKNLMSGMTLGEASYKALQLVRAKLATMDKNNHVTKFLIRINKRRSKRIAKRIIPTKNRDARIIMILGQREKAVKEFPKLVTNALNTINTISARYKPKAKTITKPMQKPQQIASVTQKRPRLVNILAMFADPRAYALQQQRQRD